MEIKEIRAKSDKELLAQVETLRKEQFNLRMQHAAGQMPRGHLINNVRKDIAKVKTVLNERVKAGKK
jgi:large subunit ribosomal protein L29